MKRAMKLISIICVIAMALSCTVFAYAPSYYDGATYESLGLESDDPDGEINLAVISATDVKLGNTMYVKGSIYSNGTIYTIDGAGNKIDGLFISGTGDTTYGPANPGGFTEYTAVGYKIVDSSGNEETTTAYDSKPTYNGAIYDTNTSFECTYEDYTVPTITNATAWTSVATGQWGWDEETQTSYAIYEDKAVDTSGSIAASEYNTSTIYTVTQDTYFGQLSLQGSGLIIDATSGPINIVIDEYINSLDGYYTIYGDYPVNIYINHSSGNYGENVYKLYTQKEVNGLNDSGIVNSYYNYSSDDDFKEALAAVSGNENVTFYLGGTDDITLQGSYATANVVTAQSLQVGEASFIIGDFTVGGDFKMAASNIVWGTVCAPNSDTYIGSAAILYGQLHTYDLDMAGAGAIIYQSDSVTTTTASLTVSEATATPEAEATATPTATPEEEKAKIVRYTVATGEYARGTMDTKTHYPARGTNLDGEEEAEISYEVLDETTFTVTGPQYISDKTKNEVQEILTTTNDVFVRLAADDSDLQSSARHTFNASRFGRIDSNGVDYSLSINPYVYPQIKDDITTMYLCWGDKTDNVEVIWYVIPQADLDAGL